MKVYRLLPAASLALFAGCSGDSVSKLVTPDASAAVRWVNAVPDTMPLDYRVVDVLTNANEASISYRGSSGGYRRVPPGAHRIRVFLAGTTAACNAPSVVSTVVLDTTLTFAVNHYYTVIHAGYMKSGASPKHKLFVSDDVLPTVSAGNIAVRAVNAMGNVGSTDFFFTAGTSATGANGGAAAFPGVAYGATTSYSTLATADSTVNAAQSYRVAATTAGTTTPNLASALMPVGTPAYAGLPPGQFPAPGQPAVPGLDPIAGTQQSGSVMTTVAMPAAVTYTLTSTGASATCPPVGSTTTVAPSGALATAGIVTLLDKNPKDAVLGQ